MSSYRPTVNDEPLSYCAFFENVMAKNVQNTSCSRHFFSVLRLRIRKFLGLPDPDPLVRGTRSESFYQENSKIPTVL
jgi:hypothetical protein